MTSRINMPLITKVVILTAALVQLASIADGICFGELGCFPKRPPWSTAQRPIPDPNNPQLINTRIALYSRNNQWKGNNVTLWPTLNLEGSDYQTEKQTVFIVQGHALSWNVTWLHQLKNALLSKEDANVFLTQYRLAASPNDSYLQAVADTRIVGAEIARLCRYLVESLGTSPAKIHLIGFSMGAHIVAYVGQNVSGIARITALDPTENGFENHPKIVRLDADDAVLVEAIHTAITPAMPGYAGGLNIPVGDVDFFLNGGMVQPGCHPENISVQSSADLLKIPDKIIRNVIECSHFRAVDVYIEAVNNTSCLFWGRKRGTNIESGNCTPSTCRSIGLDNSSTSVGIFDVVTGSTSPYCLSVSKVNTQTPEPHLEKNEENESKNSTIVATNSNCWNYTVNYGNNKFHVHNNKLHFHNNSGINLPSMKQPSYCTHLITYNRCFYTQIDLMLRNIKI